MHISGSCSTGGPLPVIFIIILLAMQWSSWSLCWSSCSWSWSWCQCSGQQCQSWGFSASRCLAPRAVRLNFRLDVLVYILKNWNEDKRIISRSCFLRVIETLTKLPSPQSFRCEQSSWPLTIIELGIFFISYALLHNFHLFAFRVLVSKSYIKTCKSQVCKTLFNVLSCWNSERASGKKKFFVSLPSNACF